VGKSANCSRRAPYCIPVMFMMLSPLG
jgi:hypothetical protein